MYIRKVDHIENLTFHYERCAEFTLKYEYLDITSGKANLHTREPALYNIIDYMISKASTIHVLDL